jgi:mono/diheme cytochrome c family protein
MKTCSEIVGAPISIVLSHSACQGFRMMSEVEDASLLCRWRPALAVAIAILMAGCSRPIEEEYTSSDAVNKLAPELQKKVVAALNSECGTPAAPKLIGNDRVSPEQLKRGEELYTYHCSRCHGTTGDGKGAMAEFMRPRPRDYRRGVFKFTTTPYGYKPRRADLLRTLRRGVPGTSMPSFKLLPDEDLNALVDYVLVLTHRGEMEVELAIEADTSNDLAATFPAETVKTVLENWDKAKVAEVQALTPMPVFTADNVRKGRQAFLTKGCSKCHGEDGRGLTRDNAFTDIWGFQTRAADLTSGMLRGGSEPVDVYRRIYSGINGTPMPSFSSSLAQEPQTMWDLVSYVLYVSNRRRNGDIPPAAPFPQAQTTAAIQGTSQIADGRR